MMHLRSGERLGISASSVARQPVFSFRDDLGNRHQRLARGSCSRARRLGERGSKGCNVKRAVPLRGLFRTVAEIAAAAGAALIGGIAIWSLRSLRRGRQLEKSLAEATLDRDAKTHWFTLEIVMRTCSGILCWCVARHHRSAGNENL